MGSIIIDGVEIECEEICPSYRLYYHGVNDIYQSRTMLVFVRGHMAKLLLKELLEKREHAITYLGKEYRCFVENQGFFEFCESYKTYRYGGITFIEIL